MKLMRNKWKITKDWHTWFAWHPVFLVNGDFVWLKKVKRKETWHSTYRGGFFFTECQLIGDMPKDITKKKAEEFCA